MALAQDKSKSMDYICRNLLAGGECSIALITIAVISKARINELVNVF